MTKNKDSVILSAIRGPAEEVEGSGIRQISCFPTTAGTNGAQTDANSILISNWR